MVKRAAFLVAIGAVANVTASAQTVSAGTSTVELRISATGQSVQPADYVTIYVPISTSGDTVLAARAANGAAVAKLTAALMARGVERSAVTLLTSFGRLGFIGNEAYDPNDGSMAPQTLADMAARKSASSTIRIRLTNTSLFDSVRDVLEQQNLTPLGSPLYELNDDRAARTAAVANAIATARQDADAYAAPLGLRVVRITSVSNYGDATPVIPDANFLLRMMTGPQEPTAKSVETRAQVWVNFVLAPR